MRTAAAWVVLLLGVTPIAMAQSGVTGLRPLAFGTLLPGIPANILPTDPSNSGEFTLTGNKNAQVTITFSLPSIMTGPGGASIPLSFGGSSAGYSRASSTGSETIFDPRTGEQVQLAHDGTGAVYLGGTASPGSSQRAGSYSASVTLSATFF